MANAASAAHPALVLTVEIGAIPSLWHFHVRIRGVDFCGLLNPSMRAPILTYNLVMCCFTRMHIKRHIPVIMARTTTAKAMTPEFSTRLAHDRSRHAQAAERALSAGNLRISQRI